jgi:hypothetical protein
MSDNKEFRAGVPEMDRELLDRMSREELYEYIFTLVKDIWRVDGMYFLGIEKRHDMQEATDVDAECWAYMGKVEARELKQLLGIEDPNPEQTLLILRHSSWTLSHAVKSMDIEPDGSAVLTIDKCRTQLIRIGKGLDPHPCRQVREGYLEAFAKECNPAIKLETICCPPDRGDEEYWCRWRFKLDK